MKSTKKAIVLVTGIKLTKAMRKFTAGQLATYLEYGGVTYKMNTGAGVLSQLADDYEVIAVGYNAEDQKILEHYGWVTKDRYIVADLQNKDDVHRVVHMVTDLKVATGLDVHVVHYGGASDTKVDLPHNSLLHHTWDLPGETLPDLVANSCVTLLHLLQGLKTHKVFDDQAISKVLFISAVAALRVIPTFGLDSAQKGAGHNLIRNIALDLTPEGIYITEIMPGSTDTGFFDSEYTLGTAIEAVKQFGYEYTKENWPVFTADAIGNSVKHVLDAPYNIRELSLMPYGQFPQLGA